MSFTFDLDSFATAFTSRREMVQVPNDRWLDSDTLKSVFGASGSVRGGFGPRLLDLGRLGENLCVGVVDQLENLGFSAVPGGGQRRGRGFRIGRGGKDDGERRHPRTAVDTGVVHFNVDCEATALETLD